MPMYSWYTFMKQWSYDIARSDIVEHDWSDLAAVAAEWFGRPGATEEEIQAAETR